MSRNVESRFSMNPTNIDISRSRFKRDSSVKLSFNVGDFIPFYCDEVLPGDTFSIKTSKVIRLQTLITPMMDNLYLDTYWFFVPNRLVWNHWRELMGQNSSTPWTPSVEYSIPQITAPTGGWSVGTIADYLGVPVGVSGLSINHLPFRALALIYNDWFRDENLMDFQYLSVTDGATTGGNYASDSVQAIVRGGFPPQVAKYHDYFTSALPAPQKGPDVLIPVAEGGLLPVVPRDGSNKDVMDGTAYTALAPDGTNPWTGSPASKFGIAFNNNSAEAVPLGSQIPLTGTAGTGITPVIDNLFAIQSGDIAAATINQLRLAWQIQRLYEKDARGGTRYVEIIKSHFGVTSPDARQQRPEYLGGNRIPIRVMQVIQQSETATTPQGNVSGQSLTTDVHGDFRKSFTEHGFVIGVMCARYPHSYQQGLERMWSRKGRFDFYWPALANIGEQAVLNKEIYAQGTSQDDEVFGYQEAWAEYRYKPSRVAGEMRSAAQTSLDSWHLADDYASLPALSAAWIKEDKTNVDRVLAVQSSVSNQLFCDIYIENDTVRAMPMYSIPGLVDHH